MLRYHHLYHVSWMMLIYVKTTSRIYNISGSVITAIKLHT